MKKAYRSEVQIFADILLSCLEPQIISYISRKCNLSHYAVLEKVTKLIKSKLMEEISLDTKNSMYDRKPRSSRAWKTTEEGIKFANQYKEIEAKLN